MPDSWVPAKVTPRLRPRKTVFTPGTRGTALTWAEARADGASGGSCAAAAAAQRTLKRRMMRALTRAVMSPDRAILSFSLEARRGGGNWCWDRKCKRFLDSPFLDCL